MCLLRKKCQNKFVTFSEFNTGESGQMFQTDLTRLIDASLGSIVKLRESGVCPAGLCYESGVCSMSLCCTKMHRFE